MNDGRNRNSLNGEYGISLRGRPDQSGLMFTDLITVAHFFVS